MTPQGDDAPRYSTLRDYLLVIRLRWYVILAVAVVFTAAAVAIALSQTTKYQASASVQFTDPTQGQAELLGVPLSNPQLPAQLAIAAEATLTQPPMVSHVRQALHLAPSEPLPGSVSSFIAPTTGYLVIQGEAPAADKAASIANAFAEAEVNLSAAASRRQFRSLATVALHELHALSVNDEITREVYEDRYVRLSYFAQTASPANLVTPAVPPASASSPHPVTDGALGLLVGLTLGIIGAFLVDTLDRRLRRRTEIAEELEWPILGQVREGALGGIPFVGAADRSHSSADREAFHILRRNLQLMVENDEVRSVAVTSALPEEGKSTVAASLAFAAAHAGKKTLLVEIDFRRPSLAARLGLHPRPGLVDFLSGHARPQDVVQAVALPSRDVSNGDMSPNVLAGARGAPERLLAFIAAGESSGHPAELLASPRLRSFLKEVMATYELVVLDTAPLLPVADTMELLPEVDATLVCLRATRTTRDQAQALKQVMARIPNRQIGLVLTGAPLGAGQEFSSYTYA